MDIDDKFSWVKLFEILTKSSPISLFKFKFYSNIKLEFLKLLFDNWKNRNPIFLEIGGDYNIEKNQQLEDLTKKYKAKGIVKKYHISSSSNIHEDFEWI